MINYKITTKVYNKVINQHATWFMCGAVLTIWDCIVAMLVQTFVSENCGKVPTNLNAAS